MLSVAVTTVGAIIYAFKLFYNGCLAVGFVLFSIVYYVVTTLYSICRGILSGVDIIFTDMCLFILDTYTVFDDSMTSVINECNSVFESAPIAVGQLLDTASNLPTPKPYSTAEVVYSRLHKFGKTILDAVILIFYFFLQIGNILAWVGEYLNNAPYLILLFFARKIDSILTIVTELPQHKVYGFLVMVCILTSLKSYYPIMILKINWLWYEFFPGFIKEYIWRYPVSIFKTTAEEIIIRTPTKASLRLQLEREKAEKSCVVCMDGKRTVMLLYCKHLCMCATCARIVMNNSGSCPICRNRISELVSVYT